MAKNNANIFDFYGITELYQLIGGLIALGLGIYLIYFGIGGSLTTKYGFGIMSPQCQNLTLQGYYEDQYQWVHHDSCIIGNYTWDPYCEFWFPWQSGTRCMPYWDWDNNTYENETCNDMMMITNKSQMRFYNSHCTSSPLVKGISLFPGIFGIGFVGIGVAILWSYFTKSQSD